MSELEWQEAIKIPDGNHYGEITKVTERTEPYEYTDIFVKLDDLDVELRYGCPTMLSENSKLGRLMVAFGQKFEVGSTLDPEKVLVGKRVVFMTLTKKNKDNKEFSEIVADSLKPEVETDKV